MFCYCLRKGACCIANAVDGTEDDYLTKQFYLECADLRNENLQTRNVILGAQVK